MFTIRSNLNIIYVNYPFKDIIMVVIKLSNKYQSIRVSFNNQYLLALLSPTSNLNIQNFIFFFKFCDDHEMETLMQS